MSGKGKVAIVTIDDMIVIFVTIFPVYDRQVSLEDRA